MVHGIVHSLLHAIQHGVTHGAEIIAPTPTFRAVSAKFEGTDDITVTWPSHAADDVGLLIVESDGAEIPSTPSGWALLTQAVDTAGTSNSTRCTVFWRRAASGSESAVTIADVGNHLMAIMAVYSGCRTFAVPYSTVATDDTNGTPSTSCVIPGSTTYAPNCRVVLIVTNGAGWDAGAMTNANLGSITERFDDYSGLGNNGAITLADGTYTGPGNYGSTSCTMGSSVYQARISIALTGSSRGGESSISEYLASLGIPVTSARVWTTGLSDDGYFTLQTFNYGSSDLPEWHVFNLNTGAHAMYSGPTGVFANSNYTTNQDGTTLSDSTGGNQVRASNGRIFFPLKGTQVAYWDPTDKQVHHLSAITDSLAYQHAAVFRLVFGNDGMIYGTTQADSGTSSKPMVFKINPTTLATTELGHVGTLPNDLLYGYYLAVEDAGTYSYVAVGQDPWELWSLNNGTGVATKLTPALSGPYTHIEFNEVVGTGWTVRFANATTSADYYLIDGALYATDSGFTHRTVTPSGPSLLSGAWDVDWLDAGNGTLRYRTCGSTDPYNEILFSPTTAPITLEAVTTLADGDVLVCAEQYNGFARYDGTFDHLLAHILSQPVFAEDGTWMTGYPNGLLYQHDPDAAWNPGTNPVLKGNFSGSGLLSDMKYAYFLQKHASNGRLYCVGRRERSGDGSGIAYYDIGGDSFEGHHDDPLADYQPRGMVVLDDKVVFSGESLDGVTASKLLVYDLDLVLDSQQSVSSWTNNGLLFAVPGEANTVLGINDDTVYRYDVSTQSLLSSSSLGGAVGAVTQRESDGKLLAMIGDDLVEINPTTLATTVRIGGIDLGSAVTGLHWKSSKIYVIAGATLYEVR